MRRAGVSCQLSAEAVAASALRLACSCVSRERSLGVRIATLTADR